MKSKRRTKNRTFDPSKILDLKISMLRKEDVNVENTLPTHKIIDNTLEVIVNSS